MGSKSPLEKNLKIIIPVVIVSLLGAGGVLLLATGNSERNQIPQATTQTQTQSKTNKIIETTTQEVAEPGVSKRAQDLFNARVAKLDDAIGVARLMEVVDLRGKVGNHKPVELQTAKDPKYMQITFDKKTQIPPKDRNAFDNEMKKYAQQILALVADADQIRWSYTIVKSNGKKEKVNVVFDARDTTPLVKEDVKTFGTSAKKIDALLKLQETPGKDINV